ncbi:hypothetical protein LIER_00173 [Lithospermum erythrorhizon]|uniref:Uncharacterized protein n=1 Tax=Lithospermum erythrorhizon TaxID=34254 RepID=A0AAV3NH82_LITER
MVEHCPWDCADRHSFDVLRVGIYLEEEVYSTAFLSCWLYVFVLPAELLDLICASVFKMASFMANSLRVSLVPPFLASIYRSLSQISLSHSPSTALEYFPPHYLFGWMGSNLHAQHTATNRPAGPQIVRYHGKGRGKAYAFGEAYSVLHSCLVTWKATRPDREQPFLYDDRTSQSPSNQAPFFGYTLTIPSLSSSIREMADLATGLKLWCSCVSSRSNTTPHSPPISYKNWLNKLFPSEAPRFSSMRYGKGKGLVVGVHPSTLVFQSTGSSKRKHSSSSTMENRDPKHASGA